jgi:hypothetical protein
MMRNNQSFATKSTLIGNVDSRIAIFDEQNDDVGTKIYPSKFHLTPEFHSVGVGRMAIKNRLLAPRKR